MKIHPIIAVAITSVLGACSTVVNGNTQSVAVNTPGVEGAICDLRSPVIGNVAVKTPGSVTLEKSKHDIEVTCRKECYADASATISSNFEGMTFGNVLIGGVIGIGIDAASGAMNKYQPSLAVPMEKKEGCA